MSATTRTSHEAARPETVFIVDDEFLPAEKAMRDLETAGWKVLGFECDLGKGLEAIRQKNPDIVLLDIRFASDSDAGLRLAEEIRTQSIRDGVESPFVVFLTAYGDEEIRQRARSVPGSLFLAKPIDEVHLVKAFETAVDHLKHIRDAQWALATLEETGFRGLKGEYVAVFNCKVVDHGDDEEKLRNRVAHKLRVDPSRIVIEYKGDLP